MKAGVFFILVPLTYTDSSDFHYSLKRFRDTLNHCAENIASFPI